MKTVASANVAYLCVSADGSILFDPANDSLLKLTPVTTEIWTMLASGMSEPDVAAAISAKCEVDVARVAEDIKKLIENGKQMGLSPEKTIVSQAASVAQGQGESFPWYGEDADAARPAARKSLVFVAVVGLTIFDVILSMLSFERMCAAVERYPVKKRVHELAEDFIGQVCSSVQRACVYYPKKAVCLQRSAVTACILRHFGVPAKLVVGIRQMPFLGHAWVEANDSVINDFPKVREFYQVVNSY